MEKEKVLLACSSEASARIRRTIGENRAYWMNCDSLAYVHQIISLQVPDLLILKLPLKDGGRDEDAVRLAMQKEMMVLLIVDQRNYDTTVYRVRDAGVFVLPWPLDERMLYESFEMLMQCRRRIESTLAENIRLKAKIEELKLVSRAKAVLIKEKGMSEEDAHACVQRYAMDHSVTMAEASRQIIASSEPMQWNSRHKKDEGQS